MFINQNIYRGPTEVTKQAHDLIAILIKDPEVNIISVITKSPKVTSAWDKFVVIELICNNLLVIFNCLVNNFFL